MASVPGPREAARGPRNLTPARLPSRREGPSFPARSGWARRSAMDGTQKKTGVTPPPLPMRNIPAPPVNGGAALSTPQLVKEIVDEVKELGRKQIELAMAEVRTDLRREAFAAADLIAGAVGAAITLTLLLVTIA